ncbi:MAG: VCBS repeat-containing protein, partial [Candidatus Altiarchaeota archaeon]|nr:VCBS repeat-containing protein [Candidatus Altiarchaeota archaeon]
VEDINQSLTPVGECSLIWGNYDNDGDLDLAICGCSHEHGSLRPACDEKVTKVYENVNGILVEDASQNIIGISLGSLAWGDYDNDGDLDLALSGKPLSTGSVSKIYNNIDTYLLEDIEQSLHPLQYSSLIWVDYDNDGDLDLTLNGVGWDGISKNPTKIYVNDQSLSPINNPPNPPLDNSSREVTLSEVLALISRLASGGPSAILSAVVELITAWVDNW